MCEKYSALPDVDKFEIVCASNLGNFDLVKINIISAGFFKSDYYLVSNTIQYNLSTMLRIPLDECILISNIKRDSVQFAMW